jgi:hypothetical protein
MTRDERWPIGWTVTLMSIHLLVAIALLGIAASDLANYYGVTYTASKSSISQIYMSVWITGYFEAVFNY